MQVASNRECLLILEASLLRLDFQRNHLDLLLFNSFSQAFLKNN